LGGKVVRRIADQELGTILPTKLRRQEVGSDDRHPARRTLVNFVRYPRGIPRGRDEHSRLTVMLAQVLDLSQQYDARICQVTQALRTGGASDVQSIRPVK
jgi:hypothetical protein